MGNGEHSGDLDSQQDTLSLPRELPGVRIKHSNVLLGGQSKKGTELFMKPSSTKRKQPFWSHKAFLGLGFLRNFARQGMRTLWEEPHPSWQMLCWERTMRIWRLAWTQRQSRSHCLAPPRPSLRTHIFYSAMPEWWLLCIGGYCCSVWKVAGGQRGLKCLLHYTACSLGIPSS